MTRLKTVGNVSLFKKWCSWKIQLYRPYFILAIDCKCVQLSNYHLLYPAKKVCTLINYTGISSCSSDNFYQLSIIYMWEYASIFIKTDLTADGTWGWLPINQSIQLAWSYMSKHVFIISVICNTCHRQRKLKKISSKWMRKDVNILKQISRTKLSLESKHKYPSLYQDISIGMCLLPCLSSKIINA